MKNKFSPCSLDYFDVDISISFGISFESNCLFVIIIYFLVYSTGGKNEGTENTLGDIFMVRCVNNVPYRRKLAFTKYKCM